MKVPDNLIYSIFQQQDARIRRELNRLTIEIATGKKLLNVSDDVTGTYDIVRLKKDIAELSQFSRNRLFADINLTYIDFVLSKMEDKLKEVYTKTVQAKNQIQTPDNLKATGVQIREALDFLLNKANEKLGDNYLFSGSALEVKPFDENFNYRGSEKEFSVQIEEGNFVTVFGVGRKIFTTNVYELDTTFNSPDAQLGADGTLTIEFKGQTFTINYAQTDTLEDFVNNLNSTLPQDLRAYLHQKPDGTYTVRIIPEDVSSEVTFSFAGTPLGNFEERNIFQIVNELQEKLSGGLFPDESDLIAVQRSYDKVAYERASFGSILSQVRIQQELQETKEDVLNREKSEIEDAVLSESIMEYTRYRIAYEALMRIVADSREITILRYI